MKEDADGMATTDCIFILLEITFECSSISSLYDIHAHVVHGLDGFVDGTLLLVIVCVTEPVTIMRDKQVAAQGETEF